MVTSATVKELVAFFSTPEKPVKGSELVAFKKADPDGLDKLEARAGLRL